MKDIIKQSLGTNSYMAGLNWFTISGSSRTLKNDIKRCGSDVRRQ
jgi:hypothetical protein